MTRLAAPASVLLALGLALAPVVGALAMSGSPSTVAAGPDDITWSVEPAPTADGTRRLFEYTVDPGTQIVDKLVVTNSGPTTADFVLYATDAINEAETGAFGLLERDVDPVDVGSWTTLTEDALTIEPGMQATVPFDLLVPSDATPGDHVGGIVASVITEQEEDGQAVTLEQRVGARIYLSVSGAPDVGVEVAGLVAGFEPSFNPFAGGDLTVAYDVSNTGNLRLDVDQTVKLAGPFGIPLGELTPDAVHNLLPGQSVHQTMKIPAVAALALAWSTVTLVPAEAADDILPPASEPGTEEPATEETPADADPTPQPTTPEESVIETGDAVDFIPSSGTTVSLAVSWTMLALVVAVAAIVYLVWRYVTVTRERMYDAIDEAAAAARDESRSGELVDELAGR